MSHGAQTALDSMQRAVTQDALDTSLRTTPIAFRENGQEARSARVPIRNGSTDSLSSMIEHQDVATLAAENLELKKMVDALKFFDDPDVMSSREKGIIRHTFQSIAGPNGTLHVREFKLLNDRIGTNIQDKDTALIEEQLGIESDASIKVEDFLRWYCNPENDFVFKNKDAKDRFDLSGGSILMDGSEFAISKLRYHDINVPGTFEYRVSFSYNHKPISPWHDIPLFPHNAPEDEVHFICEIPKYTRAKFEIATDEPLNRIKQDVAHGVLREYKHGDMCFNYGALPQTWEDPAHFSEETQAKGDNDPLDAIEMGLTPMRTGEVRAVRVLGVLALIDSGETDWKVCGGRQC
eukprot:TRINITY_DN19675_c0_g1_i2.p1 TRINITY_DN19675_c0_g1~~TRINITY_DN19675_c0_g1_i2.p1  ORF type:complete len:350 (+),score=86.81 TRINITY_DN19675_c0_g1_i2:2-1051(+)